MKCKTLFLSLTTLLAGTLSFAEWVVLDDFEREINNAPLYPEIDLSNSLASHGWLFFSDDVADINPEQCSENPAGCIGIRQHMVDPWDSGNKVMMLQNAPEGIDWSGRQYTYMYLPMEAPKESVITIYHRIAFEEESGPAMTWGAWVQSQERPEEGTWPPAPDAAFNSFDWGNIVTRWRMLIDGFLQTEDGFASPEENVLSNAPMEANVWYDLFHVIDNANETYDLYARGGEFGDEVVKIFFGSSLFGTDTAQWSGFYDYGVGAIMLIPNTFNGTGTNSPIYLDDFRVDYDGENLEVAAGGGGTGGMEPWFGYTPDAEGWVNAEDWMGWLNVLGAPWVYSLSLQGWTYIPSEQSLEGGGWVYVMK